MTRDFSKILLFWHGRLKNIPNDFLDGRGLDADTVYYLTHIGLPHDLKDLNQAIEINFYFQADRIRNREFNGITYCVLGDDSGTHFAVSLRDNHLYAIDFDKNIGTEPVCFVNSSIDKFVEMLQLFIEFQKESNDGYAQEAELIKQMKVRMKEIDEKSISDPTRGGELFSMIP